ncbi:isochorismatase family protein [Corynebacterium hindlerae]|uniref:nicotinamidase n=1 Tax=Corynebacterium hindlerae TaxID=699041 RepID=A0A7G5FDN3_9CORY|nr:isochorismatase family protein [Corynebacterium hindlerae]QMV84724.1 isochorismatase family protein [Corynebacterium hindlerae]
MSSALLIVDVQNDFCPGGAIPAANGNIVGEKIAELVRSEHHYDYVLATRDWHIKPGTHFSKNPDYLDTWPVHCVADSLGAEFHPALDLAFAEFPPTALFPKGQYTPVYSGFEGACQGVLLEDYLKEHGITHLDIAGIATDFVVRETVLDAVRKGFKVRVLTDLVAPMNKEYAELALQEMEDAGATLV